MLAAGGYPWTVIPLEKRDNYMDALESGSVKQDIVPFAFFFGTLRILQSRNVCQYLLVFPLYIFEKETFLHFCTKPVRNSSALYSPVEG